MIKSVEMSTKDLLIRRSSFEDLEQFYQWEKMPEVTEFFSIPKNQSKEDVYKKFFADEADPGAMQFTILLKDGKMIGRIVLADTIEGWKGEIWRIYIADPAMRNKGYGRQALDAILDLCFGSLKMERVYLDFYTGNPAEFLYKAAGFTEEGVLRRNCRKDGKLYDVHLMSMLKEEYEKLK